MKNLSNPFYFLHIPKTAGTSLSTFLEANYRKGKWLKAHEIKDLLAFSREEINSYQCFHGHFGTLLFALLNNPVTTITMLRDPLDRLISHIYFGQKWLSENPEFYEHLSDELSKTINIFQHSSLEEIVENPILNMYFSNVQSRHLGCELNLDTVRNAPVKFLGVLIGEEQDMNIVVAKAKERLDQMAIVGITERFNDSCDLICDFLNIKPPQIYPQLNVTSKQYKLKTYDDISPELANKIREINKYDMEVYEYGKKIFERQMKIFEEKKAKIPSSL
ncbi:sulfotransferase family 2 domain-containing protein [Geminocystis sp. GBBB08]|uniref:sulfotransferase family 2 domain-containing protein n=1 Tax=Geminocystis sp. GBBB08 TaxID=2604140 RepID=UPI0027E2AF49|nr:sulfotransferase family 2 domain-containing protein [Geminocystis sp. GBBB08]MBL1210221.1 sulfotransferase family protein [Geminocystis sp. GBBB08]